MGSEISSVPGENISREQAISHSRNLREEKVKKFERNILVLEEMVVKCSGKADEFMSKNKHEEARKFVVRKITYERLKNRMEGVKEKLETEIENIESVIDTMMDSHSYGLESKLDHGIVEDLSIDEDGYIIVDEDDTKPCSEEEIKSEIMRLRENHSPEPPKEPEPPSHRTKRVEQFLSMINLDGEQKENSDQEPDEADEDGGEDIDDLLLEMNKLTSNMD